jgi:2-amino-4-hydroxy-6-hydroxymethyldihydropteridine diphosphokinase
LEAVLDAFPSVGLKVAAASRWWRSTAWPDATHPDYLNGVALVETGLDPRETLESLLRLEEAFGRRRGALNSPRTLDLDLISHGQAIRNEPDFSLPHPRAHDRRFVMGPLAEIAPTWVHPVLGKTAEVLALTAEVGADAAPLIAKSGRDDYG